MFFTVEKAQRYVDDLRKYVYSARIPIEEMKCHVGDLPGAYKTDYDDGNWSSFAIGSAWGGRDVTAWFRARVSVPEEWRARKVALYFILGAGQEGGLRGSESLIYIDGKPVQGLDMNHREVYLKPEWVGKGFVTVAIKAFSGLQDEPKVFRTAELVLIDEETEDFYYRTSTILQTVQILKKGSYDYEKLLSFLNEAINRIDFRKPGSSEFYRSIAAANAGLKARLNEYRPHDENRPVITAVGHSHIDVAWLWRLCHTREKCSRTFSTVLHLMDQYSEYCYLQSTPQLYDFIRQDYPEIYERIKEKVKEGKWEVTGGMWVEADCNIPSGESLVRQFLYGTRFMRDEFGVECSILWLPDVFGYSWALPQIIRKSGLKYFMTTKISWSQFNRPQYDTFRWGGLDGTEVLTHFITTTESESPRFYTYNGILNPPSAVRTWEHYQQKDLNDELLLAYGWGDGGGGPTKEMIETGRKVQELPGIPEIRFGKAESYFRRLAEKVMGNPNLPVVDGELYLEYHRGTYTSQARTKKNNRLSEILYHDVELFNTLAQKLVTGFTYPKAEIDESWKTILRNQFHDILPGSSIHGVYEDSAREYARVLDSGRKMLSNALEALAASIGPSGPRLVVFNPLSWARDGSLTLPWDDRFASKSFVTEDGKVLYSKVVERAGEKVLRLRTPKIPALGYRSFRVVESSASPAFLCGELRVSEKEVENRYFHICLNEKGQITSIYDKELRREVVPNGTCVNVLQTFEDRPMNFDAWDIDLYYQEKQYEVDDLVESSVEEAGPDRAVIRFKWRVLDSVISSG